MTQRGIIGDLDQIDLPMVNNDPQLLEEEQRKARFSKTKEFKELKDQIDRKIEFYSAYLPGGVSYEALLAVKDFEEIGKMTVLSSTIIGEFRQLIQTYETANEAVKEAAKNG